MVESEDGRERPEDEEVLQVKMDMKGETRSMFLFLKKYYNLGFNSELIRLLIKQVYDQVTQA